MRARVDEHGQITISPEILQRAGIVPGEEVEVEIHHGAIELAPGGSYARLEERNGWLVATVPPGTTPITRSQWRAYLTGALGLDTSCVVPLLSAEP